VFNLSAQKKLITGGN